jgi:hypothetical protein
MQFDWIFVLGIPIIVVTGVVIRFARGLRAGLRGKQLFRSTMRSVSVAMQGESVKVGLPIARLEPHGRPRLIEENTAQNAEHSRSDLEAEAHPNQHRQT